MVGHGGLMLLRLLQHQGKQQTHKSYSSSTRMGTYVRVYRRKVHYLLMLACAWIGSTATHY